MTATLWFFAIGALLTLANVPLLIVPASAAEQRLWRRLGVQHLRRRITRRRDPRQPHREGRTLAVARRNIVWHLVLSGVFTAEMLQPFLVRVPFHLAAVALLCGCVAYLTGSILQRQKIVVARNERARHGGPR
ncbi:MAG: hypothetical protein JO197_10505 [Acidobacteria bacterium]|nr:hypothetical protein [Acidobacteriota bacterium]MBV9475515.1 hypothetical protein [Acidobacteriota bacterium]